MRPPRALLLLACAAIFLLPRLALLGPDQLTLFHQGGDIEDHLSNTDLLLKRLTLPAAQRQDPYFAAHPDALAPTAPARWRPGLYLLALPAAALFGVSSIWTTQLTNLLCALLLALGAFLLGRDLGGERLGLQASLLTLLHPALAGIAWTYGPEVPLTAVTAAGLWLLWRADGLRRRGYALAFGGCCWLGCLIKLTYPAYLTLPALWALARGLRGGPRRAVLANAGLALALFGALLCLVLPPPPAEVWRELRVHLLSRGLDAAVIPPWTPGWAGAYAGFAALGFTPPLLALALPGVVWLHRRPREAGKALLLCALWGSYLALTLLASKLERYLHPVYPVVGLASLWWLQARLRPPWGALAGAVFAASHLYPTPWLLDPRSDPRSLRSPHWYEGRRPGLADLAAVRAGRTSNACDLRPLVGRIVSLAAGERSARPLGVAYLNGSQRAFRPGEDIREDALRLALLQELPGRYVVAPPYHATGLGRIPSRLRDVPSLFVVHPLGARLAQLPPPGMQQRAEELVCAPCPGQTQELAALCPGVSLVLRHLVPSNPLTTSRRGGK